MNDQDTTEAISAAPSAGFETQESDETAMEFVSLPNLLIKDEPQDDPSIPCNEETLTVEADPMNLLEEVNEDQEIEDTDSNSTKPSEIPTPQKWQDWMEQHPWLLHEEEDDCYGYCLYCDVQLNIRSLRYLEQHALSLYHKERKDNYLAFKSSEKEAQAGSPLVVDIKTEFGTSSSIAAIKYQRMSQTELLNNFNWRRWLQAHIWLVRDRLEGTTGYCKYCRIRLNVEFSYLRDRHEEAPRHKESEISYMRRQARKERNAEKMGGEAQGLTEVNAADTSGWQTDDQEANKTVDHTNPYYEPLPNTKNGCRCCLCDAKMSKFSFNKHLRTKSHMTNLRLIGKRKAFVKNVAAVKQEFRNKKSNWKIFRRQHPWLIADPVDATYAHCKFCEKRLMYGLSMVKRSLHENSVGHKIAEKGFYERQASSHYEAPPCAEDNDVEEADSGDDDEENNGEENNDDENNEDDAAAPDDADGSTKTDDESSAAAETEGKRQKRFARGSDEWYSAKPWCQRYPEDPNYCWCVYCKTTLSLVNLSRQKHETCRRHRVGEEEHLRKAKITSKHSRGDKRTRHYPWLVYVKNNPNRVFCKYCRIRLSSGCSRTKHEKAIRHKNAAQLILANNKNKRSNRAAPTNDDDEAASDGGAEESNLTETRSKGKQAGAGEEANITEDAGAEETTITEMRPKAKGIAAPLSMQAKVMLWKKKYPWISYKRNELRTHYGYCKDCDQRIFVPTLKYALKHQKSLKHRTQLRRHKEQQKQQTTITDAVVDDEPTVDDAPPAAEETSDNITEESSPDLAKKYPWLVRNKDMDQNIGYCKYCEKNLHITGIFKLRHGQTQRHREAEKLYMERANVTATERGSTAVEATNVIVLDDDSDVLSVKSEPMDEDSILEYLLQRSITSQQNNEASEIATSAETESNEPQSKRAKTARHSDVGFDATRRLLATAQVELMRQKRSKNSAASNFQSTLSMAACLAPFVQTPPMPPTPPPPPPPLVNTSPRNTFDLFFESVSATVKNLPADLAAEGRIKFMQIIYDLEMRALRRTQSTESFNTIEISATPAAGTTVLSNSGSADTPSNSSSMTNDGETEANNSERTATTTANGVDSTNTPYRIVPLSSTPASNSSDSLLRKQVSPPTPISQSVDKTLKRVQMNAALQITPRIDSTIRCIPITSLTQPKRNSSSLVLPTKAMQSVDSSGSIRQVEMNGRPQTTFIPVKANSTGAGVRRIVMNPPKNGVYHNQQAGLTNQMTTILSAKTGRQYQT